MDIGIRMKANYEAPSRHTLLRRIPVIIRVDGRAFHTWVENAHLAKPFSHELMNCMRWAMCRVSEEMQGFKAGYCQSDECSFFITDYDTLQTEPWFGYVKSKIESITASMFTVEFNKYVWDFVSRSLAPAFFDARAFNVPREEVVNYFLWRAKDWERNSVAMYCRHFFSHKDMDGKGRADQHELLHSVGKNWDTDLSARERNGTWLIGDTLTTQICPAYADIAEVIDPLIYCDN